MRPVPVPESVIRARPWAVTKVFAAPNGDLTDDQIRPVEVLVDPHTTHGPALRIYAALDAGDLEVLAAGGYVEITLNTMALPVFSLAVGP